MGRLTIAGTLDLQQFWPQGESDADTAKLVVDVTPGSVRYQPTGGGSQQSTAYDGAYVKLYGTPKPVIKNGKMTVRLQGIDAPELHVQPMSMKGTKYKGKDLGGLKGLGLVKKFRQHQAETATVRLGKYLATLGVSPLACEFVTEVVDEEGPGDAIDKYGRFVGNVVVGGVDVNLEILRGGWAVVALYNSMRQGEIEACLDAWKVGRKAAGGIVKHMTQTIGTFDPELLYQTPSKAQVTSEGSRRFIHPKLYRRQCTWWAYRKKGTFKPGFDTFLTLSKHDVFYELDEFVSDASYVAVQIPIADMVEGGKKVVYRPEDVVFKDAPSTLYDAQGATVEHW